MIGFTEFFSPQRSKMLVCKGPKDYPVSGTFIELSDSNLFQIDISTLHVLSTECYSFDIYVESEDEYKKILLGMNRYSNVNFFFHPRFTEKNRNILDAKYCSLIEFFVSDRSRLSDLPTIRASLPNCNASMFFVLDLIQDFEVLLPLVHKAILDRIERITIVISKRVWKSHNFVSVTSILEYLGANIVLVSSVYEAVNIIKPPRGASGLLITASESSAPGHSFCHSLCKLVGHNIRKITIQHGYECVGLRHHKEHDLQFPKGVRFASDFIFSWSNIDLLSNIHPLEVHKVISVGVVKSFACSAERTISQTSFDESEKRRLSCPEVLIAENLHSVRFREPSRFQGFLAFIRESNSMNGKECNLRIRSHPGKRKLQTLDLEDEFLYEEGALTATTVQQFDMVCSPPSTIVLDSVLSGVPVCIWSHENNLADTKNYDSIAKVFKSTEMFDLIRNTDAVDNIIMNFRWGASNTSAFNGVEYAWQKMREIG